MVTFELKTQVTDAQNQKNAENEAVRLASKEFSQMSNDLSYSSEKVEPGVYNVTVTVTFDTYGFAEEDTLSEEVSDELPDNVSVWKPTVNSKGVVVSVWIPFSSGGGKINHGMDVPDELLDGTGFDEQVEADARAAVQNVIGESQVHDIEADDGGDYRALSRIVYSSDAPPVKSAARKAIKSHTPSEVWDEFDYSL